MPRVSKMPAPLKTYSKFQIRIFILSLHVVTSWEIRDSIVIIGLIDFFVFDYFGVSTAFANMPNFLFCPMAHLCSLLDPFLGSTFSCFYGFTKLENLNQVK